MAEEGILAAWILLKSQRLKDEGLWLILFSVQAMSWSRRKRAKVKARVQTAAGERARRKMFDENAPQADREANDHMQEDSGEV